MIMNDHDVTCPLAADALDHRAVPLNERSEGSFVPLFDETPKQLLVSEPRPIRQMHGPAEVLDDIARLAGRHLVSPSPAWPLYFLLSALVRFDRRFSCPS